MIKGKGEGEGAIEPRPLEIFGYATDYPALFSTLYTAYSKLTHYHHVSAFSLSPTLLMDTYTAVY